jgi:hypothetical protein
MSGDTRGPEPDAQGPEGAAGPVCDIDGTVSAVEG